jgi:GR25 family glycosyltransferase involved in LPS biosynthesis
MESTLKKYNVSFKRIQAIDGNTLTDPKNTTHSSPKYWNKYALGLVRSFSNLLDDAIANNYKNILVFEDDICLCEDFINVFNSYYTQLPIDKWDLVQLSAGNHNQLPKYIPSSITSSVTSNLFKTTGSFGTYAMLLNTSCFKELKRLCLLEDRPLDKCIIQYQKTNDCLLFYPGIAFPKADVSDILGQYMDYSAIWNYCNDPRLDAIIKGYKDKIQQKIIEK